MKYVVGLENQWVSGVLCGGIVFTVVFHWGVDCEENHGDAAPQHHPNMKSVDS